MRTVVENKKYQVWTVVSEKRNSVTITSPSGWLGSDENTQKRDETDQTEGRQRQEDGESSADRVWEACVQAADGTRGCLQVSGEERFTVHISAGTQPGAQHMLWIHSHDAVPWWRRGIFPYPATTGFRPVLCVKAQHVSHFSVFILLASSNSSFLFALLMACQPEVQHLSSPQRTKLSRISLPAEVLFFCIGSPHERNYHASLLSWWCFVWTIYISREINL